MSSLLGHIYRALARYDDAEEHFRSLRDAAPNDSYGWYGLLSVLRDQSRLDDLTPILNEARERFPDVELIRKFDPKWSIPSPVGIQSPVEPRSVAEVRTRRRRLERLADGGEDVRDKAASLIGAIDAIGGGAPLELDRSAEKGLLMAQSGGLDDAVGLLGSLFETFRQSPRIAYTLARLNRMAAAKDTVKYDKAEFSRLYAPMRQFREESPGSRLVGMLAGVNLTVSMSDGEALARRRDELVQGLLSENDRPRASMSNFESWWLGCVVEWERRFDLAPLRRSQLAPPPSDSLLTV